MERMSGKGCSGGVALASEINKGYSRLFFAQKQGHMKHLLENASTFFQTDNYFELLNVFHLSRTLFTLK